MSGKRLLLLMRHAPYQGMRATEALEAALVSSVFDVPTSVLFKDDGIWQLLANQNGSDLGVRTHSRILTALPDYDVTGLYACRRSMEQRSILPEQLAISVTLLDYAQQQQLLAEHELVLND